MLLQKIIFLGNGIVRGNMGCHKTIAINGYICHVFEKRKTKKKGEQKKKERKIFFIANDFPVTSDFRWFLYKQVTRTLIIRYVLRNT